MLTLPKSYLIVDDDSSIRFIIKSALKTLSPEVIDEAPDGKTAYELALQNNYQLIILDWMLPGIHGSILFNKLREHSYYKNIPFIIISGFIRKYDFSIIDDYVLSALLEKPFQKDEIVDSVHQLSKQASWYYNQSELIKKIDRGDHEKDNKEGAKIREIVMRSKNSHFLAVATAKIFSDLDFHYDAELLFKHALRSSKYKNIANIGLGRIYLKLQNFELAKKYLTLAINNSPENLNNRLSLGNIYLNELAMDNAGIQFDRMLKIDPANDEALTGQKMIKMLVDTDHSSIVHNNMTLSKLLIEIGNKLSPNEKVEFLKDSLSHIYQAESRENIAKELMNNSNLSAAESKELESWVLDQVGPVSSGKKQIPYTISRDAHHENTDMSFLINESVSANDLNQWKNLIAKYKPLNAYLLFLKKNDQKINTHLKDLWHIASQYQEQDIEKAINLLLKNKIISVDHMEELLKNPDVLAKLD